jgi:hypothetical protein
MASLSATAPRRITIAVAAVLAAGCVIWAASPVHGGGPGTEVALIVAVATAALSVIRLAVAGLPRLTVPFLASAARQAADSAAEIVGAVPWAEGMLVAVLVLEALHPARPWHTGVLGLALLGYLFATHLAETRARPRVLRGQLPLLAAGLGLLALAVGAAALPGHPSGPAAFIATTVTVVATVIVVALVLPGTGPGQR